MNRATFVLLLSLLTPNWATACSIASLDREISFLGNATALSSDQVRSIASWYIDLRDGRLGVADVMIYANSIEGDEPHAKLVESRVRNVATLVRTLAGSDVAPMTTRITPHRASEVEQFPEVVASVQPKCAATQSCCGTDPNLR